MQPTSTENAGEVIFPQLQRTLRPRHRFALTSPTPEFIVKRA
jgi:hypothetical protein